MQLISAINNTDGGDNTLRSVWVPTQSRLGGPPMDQCKESWECNSVNRYFPRQDNVCVEHNWAYNGQTETMKGCWNKSVCKNEMGTSSFEMFDGRMIQFFCGK